MPYMGDAEFWNEKFKARDHTPMNPEQALIERLALLKKGTVLDVACGDGRNSLYLAAEGFRVTGIDFSVEALKRLNAFAAQRHLSIRTLLADLSRPDWMEGLGAFDTVLVSHYRLSPEHLGKIHEHLNPKGILLVTGFGPKPPPDSRLNENDLIKPEDFRTLAPCLAPLAAEIFEDERGAFVTYVFRRGAQDEND